MKKIIVVTFALATTALWAFSPAGNAHAAANGAQLFQQRCSACHPGGGNIINPKATLHKANREANKVNTVEAIVGKMRNPGPGMSKFDSKVLPDSDAKAIAEYVLKTF